MDEYSKNNSKLKMLCILYGVYVLIFVITVVLLYSNWLPSKLDFLRELMII